MLKNTFKDMLNSIKKNRAFRVIWIMFLFTVSQLMGILLITLYEAVSRGVGYDEGPEETQALMKLLMDEAMIPTMLISSLLILAVFIIKAIKKKQWFIKWKGDAKLGVLTGTGGVDTLFLAIATFAAGAFASVTLSPLLDWVLSKIPQDITSTYATVENSVEQVLTTGFFVSVFVVGILGPLCEELMFRYAMVNLFLDPEYGEVKRWHALVIPAVAFGVMHLNLVQGIYAGLFGLLFGFMYMHSNNMLLVPALFHMGVNTTSLLITNAELQGKDSANLLIMTAVIAVAVFVMSAILRKQFTFQKNINQIPA